MVPSERGGSGGDPAPDGPGDPAGYATQLVTVRAIGTFQPDPTAVPEPVVAAVARQLGIADPGVLAGYPGLAGALAAHRRDPRPLRVSRLHRPAGPVRRHRWLYRQAWADDVAPSVLFRAAHRQLLARQILLPGRQCLTRLVAAVRERATRRFYRAPARAAAPELRARWTNCWLVPEGTRRSELDLLRRPPFTPTITGLVRALDRLDESGPSGSGGLDLSGLAAARVVALARYADQAWATQLADLAPHRRIATLAAYTHLLAGSARDDVIDIFDVVFGDLQRAATHRGQKRRAGELRDYDRAVAAVHARMRSLLDALDDAGGLAAVLDDAARPSAAGSRRPWARWRR